MLSNLLMPAVLFFALGFLVKLIKSDLRFTSDLAKALSMCCGRKNLNDAAECGGALLAVLFPPGSSTAGPQIAGPDQPTRRQTPSSCTTSYLAQRAKSARVQVPVVRAWAPAMTR